jgi:hypothetical protein
MRNEIRLRWVIYLINTLWLVLVSHRVGASFYLRFYPLTYLNSQVIFILTFGLLRCKLYKIKTCSDNVKSLFKVPYLHILDNLQKNHKLLCQTSLRL